MLQQWVESLDMISEGIYGLSYKGSRHDQDGEGLAVLRGGKILGSDRWGGVFTGTYKFDPVAEQNMVHVRIDIPPDGELITGFAAGSTGASFEIVAAFGRAAPKSAATVEIAGSMVDVEFAFIGPLPN